LAGSLASPTLEQPRCEIVWFSKNHSTYCALDEHLHAQNPDLWVWPDWPEQFRDPASAAVRQFAAEHKREILFHGWLQWNVDRQLAGAVLGGFLRNAPAQLHDLRARIDEADAPGARLQAHALKGAAATVAAEGLRAIALAMERAGAAGQLERCGELLPRAAQEFERFKSALERAGWV
jgi:HPt (histidine-containing phosphotransfer) domain-containing protein